MRMHAAVALYRLTGTAAYHDAFKTDFAVAGEPYDDDSRHWLLLYARLPAAQADATIQQRIRTELIARARNELASSLNDRAARWGGEFYMPMFLGQGTTPLISDGVLALAAAGDSLQASERQAMWAKVYTTADYFLGTNPLNMTWISRLGPRWPRGPFHLDGFTKGAAFPQMGLIPYGPVAVARDWMGSPPPGPWASNWTNSDLYPADIAVWPGHERWFDQRTGIASCEFTIHQTTVVTAVVYGALLEASGSRPQGDGGFAPADAGVVPGADSGSLPAVDGGASDDDGGNGDGSGVAKGICGCTASGSSAAFAALAAVPLLRGIRERRRRRG
jgi:hypothetical protein